MPQMLVWNPWRIISSAPAGRAGSASAKALASSHCRRVTSPRPLCIALLPGDDCFRYSSARFSKFVIQCGTLEYELRKPKGTSNSIILVPLFDLKFLRRTRGTRCRNFKSAALVGTRLRPAHGGEADERYRGEGGHHGKHHRIGRALGNEGEHERSDRLHHQIRPADAA